MPRIIITCVRHAQGYHNLTENYHLPDPDLTPLGESQCSTLSSVLSSHTKITHLVASPLRRTISTALLSFPSAVAAGVKVVALPELQETSNLECDTGSDRSVLEKEFGTAEHVDLDLVTEGWNIKQGRWSPAASAIDARARDARIWLRQYAFEQAAAHPEDDIHSAVVTHGGFLHYFTEDWNGHERFTGIGWANTEYRSYQFVNKDGDDQMASLVELESSRDRRGERPLSEAEQRNLRDSAEKEWALSGHTTPREMTVEQIAVS